MSRRSLENLLTHKESDRCVQHHDPSEGVHHNVMIVVFLAMLMFFGIFLFLTAEQTPHSAVTFAIYEFEPVTIHKDIADGIAGFIDDVRVSQERPMVLLLLYTFWIAIFGLINMVLYERSRR